MTAALREACAHLERWLPEAAALTAQPDTDGTTAHGKPGSRPPWNAAAANATMDAHAGIRDLEAVLFYQVTGRPRRERGGSDGNTYAAIRGVAALAASVTQDAARQAERDIIRLVVPIRQLPAIDEDERFLRVHGASCYYCQVPMLSLAERSGRVTCIRYGACSDSNGDHPVGFLAHSVSGQPMIAWADGSCQYAAVTWEDVS